MRNSPECGLKCWDHANIVHSKYKLHEGTNGGIAHFVWFERKSWITASAALLFTILVI